MSWDFGTIASVTPANALANKIEAAMTDSGAYTQVDDYTPATTRYRVWSSSAGFVVVLSHASAGTGSLTVWLSETYNASNHTKGYIAPISNSFLRSDYGWTSTFGGAATGFAINTGFSLDLGTNTTGFTYSVSAVAKRLHLSSLVGSTLHGNVYLGKFDTFLDGTGGSNSISEPGAYGMGQLGNLYFYTTRLVNPVNAGANVSNGFQVTAHRQYENSTLSGLPGSINSVFDAIIVSRFKLVETIYTGAPRGLLSGVITMGSSSSYAYGDELLVNGSPKYKVMSTNTAVEML